MKVSRIVFLSASSLGILLASCSSGNPVSDSAADTSTETVVKSVPQQKYIDVTSTIICGTSGLSRLEPDRITHTCGKVQPYRQGLMKWGYSHDESVQDFAMQTTEFRAAFNACYKRSVPERSFRSMLEQGDFRVIDSNEKSWIEEYYRNEFDGRDSGGEEFPFNPIDRQKVVDLLRVRHVECKGRSYLVEMSS